MTAPDPTPSLADRVEARYAELRARDSAIRTAERGVARHAKTERKARNLGILERRRIRDREFQLRKEAALQIGQESGVRLPGFGAGTTKAPVGAKLAAAVDSAPPSTS
jgi:hypothetical protein